MKNNMNDNPWAFGMSSQYPALKADMDGDDDEGIAAKGFGLRLRLEGDESRATPGIRSPPCPSLRCGFECTPPGG